MHACMGCCSCKEAVLLSTETAIRIYIHYIHAYACYVLCTCENFNCNIIIMSELIDHACSITSLILLQLKFSQLHGT